MTGPTIPGWDKRLSGRAGPPLKSQIPIGGPALASSLVPPYKVTWSNANVNENFPDPICPLLSSIASLGYYHYFRNLGLALGISRRRVAAMEQPLRNIVGVHGARLYYNLTNIHAVLRMAPLGEMLTESFNLFVGTHRTQHRKEQLTWSGFARGRLSQACEAARIAVATTWQFLFLSRWVAKFERMADEFASATRPDSLSSRPLAELPIYIAIPSEVDLAPGSGEMVWQFARAWYTCTTSPRWKRATGSSQTLTLIATASVICTRPGRRS